LRQFGHNCRIVAPSSRVVAADARCAHVTRFQKRQNSPLCEKVSRSSCWKVMLRPYAPRCEAPSSGEPVRHGAKIAR
jgi:hypothetical protein